MTSHPSSLRAVLPFALGLFVIGLSGCLVGPTYQKPGGDVPDSWSALVVDQDTAEVNISADKLPEAEWWRAFQNDELNRLIDVALRKNHDVREAAFRVMEGRATIMAAGAGLYPQVNLTGAYSRIRRSENILVGPTSGAPQGFAPPGAEFDIWNGVVDLQWELDLWGRIRRGLEAVSADTDALEQDRRAVTLALISDLGQAYFQLRELDEQLEIAERNFAIRQDSFELVRSRAFAGLASDLDVKRAEVLVAETLTVIPDLKRRRMAEVHQIEVLTGAVPGTLDLPPKTLRMTVVQPEIPIGLPAELLERRPDVLEVEQMLIAANARIGEARAFFFPSIVITGQGGLQSSEFADWLRSGSRTFTIGPSITLPIFLGKTNVARLQVAEARYEQMLERYQQTILNAFREVADLLVAIQTRTEQLTSQQRQVNAAQETRGLAQIRYVEGLVAYLDVLEAQRTVLEAEQALVQTERARLTDMIALFKAVGGGW